MDKAHAEQLMTRLDDLRRRRNLSNRELGAALAVPAGTVQKWFAQGTSRRLPSDDNLGVIESFLKTHEDMKDSVRQAWLKVLEWWRIQHRYSSVAELASDIGWEGDALAAHISDETMPPKVVVDAIASKAGITRAPIGDVLATARDRATSVRYLLLLLEGQLRPFRDGSKAERDILRNELDFTDVGYISSLLNMLGEEDTFERWLALTGKRFNFFKKGGIPNEKDAH